jgi:hypothetical protein
MDREIIYLAVNSFPVAVERMVRPEHDYLYSRAEFAAVMNAHMLMEELGRVTNDELRLKGGKQCIRNSSLVIRNLPQDHLPGSE